MVGAALILVVSKPEKPNPTVKTTASTINKANFLFIIIPPNLRNFPT
jgi:hypothetical protein